MQRILFALKDNYFAIAYSIAQVIRSHQPRWAVINKSFDDYVNDRLRHHLLTVAQLTLIAIVVGLAITSYITYKCYELAVSALEYLAHETTPDDCWLEPEYFPTKLKWYALHVGKYLVDQPSDHWLDVLDKGIDTLIDSGAIAQPQPQKRRLGRPKGIKDKARIA